MNNIISQMINTHELSDKDSYINAFKEVIQEIALYALSKTDFFDHAAFYGGTALRIFYELDRFSEDLDFSLIIPDEQFSLVKYFKTLEETFKAYGLIFKATLKEKNNDSYMQSAFLKGNTLQHMILIEVGDEISKHIQKNDTIKIKFEIDINPPLNASYEYKYNLLPMPHKIKIYDKESLFAGKLHAVICRSWKERIKGRDLYDYVFYLSKNIRPNLEHLKNRLIESKKINKDEELNIEKLKKMLIERFNEIDFEEAKKDVKPFIKDLEKLSLWNKEFFVAITKDLL